MGILYYNRRHSLTGAAPEIWQVRSTQWQYWSHWYFLSTYYWQLFRKWHNGWMEGLFSKPHTAPLVCTDFGMLYYVVSKKSLDGLLEYNRSAYFMYYNPIMQWISTARVVWLASICAIASFLHTAYWKWPRVWCIICCMLTLQDANSFINSHRIVCCDVSKHCCCATFISSNLRFFCR